MPRGRSRRAAFAGIAIVLAIAIPVAFAAIGYDEKLTEFDFLLLGLTVTPEPPSQVVPRHTATGVRIKVAFSNQEGAFDMESLLSLLPPGLEVVGELVGPGIDAPIKLRGPPGEFLAIPPIERNGTFLVRDIHLENDGVTFLRASPDSVTVEVIDRLLVTQVITRPLTLEEIRQMGILFGEDSFTGFNFTLALTLDSHPVTIDFPVVFDSNGIPVPIRPTASLDLEGESLPLVNAGIVPVMMKPNVPPDLEIELLPLLADASIPAVLVIPGDVGFLNQVFSALLLISNGAPLASGLSVRGIEASISLPAGEDGVAGSSDDPLVPAQTQGGEFAFETDDGSNRLDPGEQGTGEFLLEGRREGFHEILFDIEGTLEGLPIGPVPMTGVARGGVLVRNPKLHLTFVAPATVRAAEEFSLFVTVTNISTTPANLVTVRLDPTRISGATLLWGPSAPIPTLGPSDSEVLEFRFLSQTTGQVRASYLNVEQGTGDLFFQLGVGERGVPLSPDTIVLPKTAESLPTEVVQAALRALGAGWSVATAPSGTLAAGVVRVAKQAVLDRAIELAEAGFRVQLGEPVSLALENLAFTWAHSEDRGFEQLLRETDAGVAFFEAIGRALGPASAVGDFQRSLSTTLSGLSSHILIGVGRGSAEAPIQWTLSDVEGHALVPNGVGTLPNAVFLSLSDNASPGRGIGIATRLGSTLYEWAFTSTAAASSSFDLTVSLPRANGRIGLHRFAGVETSPGESGRLTIDLLVSNPTLTLRIDRDADGAFEETVSETSQELIATPPPTLITATAIGPETLSGADPWGRVLALLFDRPMREAEVLDLENYTVDENAIVSASLQLSGRLSFLFMEAPVGGLVERQVGVSGLFGANGDALFHSTRTIDSRLTDAGATVSGRVLNADGTPVAGAEVLYINSIPGDVMGISRKTMDNLGRYQFDWVRKSPDGPFSMRAYDPVTGSVRALTTHVAFDGESIVVDLVLLGRGGVTGVVRDANGTPVPNAQVLVTSGLDPRSSAAVETNGDGRYVATGIVVGPISVKAVFETSSGLAFGNLARAGTFATVDVNIDLAVGTVTGRVFESYEGVETPVSDIDVFYLVPDGTGANELVAAMTKTDASGAYRFVDVPVPIGIFRIVAIDWVRSQEASIAGTFAPGQTLLVDQDVFFFIDEFGAIEVTVHDSTGSPVGAAAALVTAAGREIPTDTLGKARFDELSPGAYGVSARAASSSSSVSASATVAEAATTRVDLQLPGTGRLIVTVLDETGMSIQNQAVIRTIGDPCAGEQLITGLDGVAVFEDVPVGTATVKAVKSHDVAAGTTSIQHAGDERALVLRFSGFGTAEGVVVDANGPFLGADVVLASKRLDPAVCGFVNDAAAQQVRTGIDGAFSFHNIPLGTFTVSASEPTFFPVPVSASDVFLTPGETRTIELELASNITGELSGTVFLPDGTTPSGPGVRVTASGGARPDVTVTTDNAGRYAFAAIFPQGTYTLTASDSATGKVAREMIFLRRGQESVRDLRLLGRSPVEVTVVKGDGAPADDAFVELKGATFPYDRATGIITPFDDGKLLLPRISEGSFTVTANDRLGRGGRGTGAVTEDGILTRVTVPLSATGQVTGTFLSSNGVDPVPNAEVLLRQGSTGRLLGSTTTSSLPGEMGAFAFQYVPAGNLLATATDPLTGRVGEDSGTIETEGEAIDLTIVALGLGKLSGRVTSAGVGIAAAEVEVTSSTGLSSTIANLRATSTSGANGEFLFEGVPVGSFIIQATLPGASPLVGAVSGNISEDGEEISEIEIALEPSGTIEGEVFRANEVDTVAGAALTLVPSKGVFHAQSNASGAFGFDFVPAGDFSLRAQETGGPDAGIVTGALGEGELLTVDVIMNGTGTVAGTALDSDGSNLAAGRVRLTRPAPFPRDELTTVASDGSFAFRGVPVGDYNLLLSVDGSPLRGTATGNIPSDGATDAITIQLAPATSVAGQVAKPDGTGGVMSGVNVVA
ncbi:MAG TPA: carboxypeptidase-like regulatory domain-containing protein, partial [Vicinamibacteria bacterium]|nr:carboxypeptidase-like regulatory domain-containing protein [Vicinamibacteria bacterium]